MIARKHLVPVLVSLAGLAHGQPAPDTLVAPPSPSAEELVGAALTRLEGALGDRAVELDVERDLVLSIDPVLFEQVLINFVENALRHGAPPFAISARRERELGILEVGDRGPGLPAESSRLFEKFVHASTSPGVGLGRAVVRAIVEAHGGTVSAENRLGGGAVFRVKLPLGRAPAIADAAAVELGS